VLAVVPVRDGVVPAGGAEVAAECGGRVLLVGSGVDVAAAEMAGPATLVEAGAFQPASWAATLAPLLTTEPVLVLPGSADGRDLAPRLAAELSRPLFAGAVVVRADAVVLARHGGRQMHAFAPSTTFVATLQPGSRGVEPAPDGTRAAATPARPTVVPATRPDPDVVEVLAADAATMDLAEAPRILGGGAGLDGADRFAELAEVAARLGASVGATRVITDRGWIGHERQIGTTGVVVDPRLYVAFGISGAVQHTSGLGTPAHIISVNTDAYCPMMQLADLAIVADANAVLAELRALLTGTGLTSGGLAPTGALTGG
jgi:electron transfer flavoprotein alpha subunit